MLCARLLVGAVDLIALASGLHVIITEHVGQDLVILDGFSSKGQRHQYRYYITTWDRGIIQVLDGS